MEVIDLTLSDSDEEEEAPRAQSSHEISSGCATPPVINIDSPAGPLSISSVSSHESPKHISSRSNSSLSPHLSSSPSSSSSSNSTIGYNYPGPSGARSPPSTPPCLHLSPRSPYKSPLQSPNSPVPSPHRVSPLGTSASQFFPHFSHGMPLPMPLQMAMPNNLYVPSTLGNINDDPEIEEFLHRFPDYSGR